MLVRLASPRLCDALLNQHIAGRVGAGHGDTVACSACVCVCVCVCVGEKPACFFTHLIDVCECTHYH